MSCPSSKSRGFWALLLVTTFSALGFAQSLSGTFFHSRTDLVVLDVAVKDHGGRFATALTADEFTVLEDNVPQHVQFFAPIGRIPLAVVLLVDDSKSMAGEPLAAAKQAAATFLRGLRPDDLVEVLAFNDLPARLYPIGTDHAAAEQTIENLSARGATQLYDAILVAQRDLERGVRAMGREYQKSIVILSDGEDTGSSQTFDDVIDDARRNTTSISAVSTRVDNHQQPLPPVRELAQLTFDTGGQLIALGQLADLTSIYDCILADLHQQYRLGYVSSATGRDGKWRKVSVRVRDSNLVTRTRAGYYAPVGGPIDGSG